MRSFTLTAATQLRQLALSLTLSALAVHAWADTVKGPDPTVASLEAKGPYAVKTAKLPSSAGYGSATTVYYPSGSKGETFGLAVFCPGFVSAASLYSNAAQRVASHGFVVVIVSTLSLIDQPKKRGAQIEAVEKAVLAQNKVPAVAYAGLIDEGRVAFGGHSAGGAGTFYAAANHPELKALVGWMAGEPGTNFKPFASINIPTLLITGQNDALASSWARPYFKQLNPDMPAVMVEMASTNHLASWNTASAASQGKLAKYTIAWLKRFVDEDTRYTPFVSSKAADMSDFGLHGEF
jgi:dienelactone hydrolase